MGDGGHDDEDDGASAPVGTPSGGWTVVGPDGRVRSFSSRDDVLASLAESNEVTAAPPEVAVGPRRLSLMPEEDPPPLPSKARRRSQPAPELPPQDLESVDSKPPPSVAEPVESVDILDAVSNARLPAAESSQSVDVNVAPDSTDALEESGPTSSDLKPEPSVRPPPVVVSMPPPLPAHLASSHADRDEGDLVSLRDLVVVPARGSEPSMSTRSSSVPPPPKAGALRTLPPPARSLAPAPPPPTITVASKPPPPVEPSTPETRAARAASQASRTATTTRPPAPAAEAKRGWLMPVAVCAVLAAVLAYATRGPTPTEPIPPTATREPPTASPTTSAATSTANTTSTLTASTSTAPLSTASGAPAPIASGAASGGPAGSAAPMGTSASAPRLLTEVDSQLALSEVLARAGTARRGGEPARAKALYDRALALTGGNVEAYAGLAELARGQGDLAGAKANYERALSMSPGFAPARIGLADVQWDLGDHEGAQRHYRELLGSHASIPERVRERAGVAAATTTQTAEPAPTAAPAPTPAAEP